MLNWGDVESAPQEKARRLGRARRQIPHGGVVSIFTSGPPELILRQETPTVNRRAILHRSIPARYGFFRQSPAVLFRATLGPISSAAARAKHRHQRLIGFAAYRAVSLNCANIDRGWVSLITLRSRGALWSLWALCPGLALRSSYALNALCALGARRSLRARVAFWTRVSAATSKRQRHADGKYR